MDALRDMANLAWRSRLLGRTLARSSLMKPLDLILDQLERYPNEDRERLRAASADEIFAYLDRLAATEFKPGRRKAEAIEQYVTIFFDRLLKDEHHGDPTRLLGRQRLLRSAYHHYVREAIPLRTFQAVGDTSDALIDKSESDASEENA